MFLIPPAPGDKVRDWQSSGQICQGPRGLSAGEASTTHGSPAERLEDSQPVRDFTSFLRAPALLWQLKHMDSVSGERQGYPSIKSLSAYTGLQ